MSSHGIIDRAENFFYFEDDLCENIEKWASQHCATFTSSNSENQEQPLQHMVLYEKYVKIFETLVESFLAKENISLEEFYTTVREEYEAARNVHKENSTFTSMLLGSLEFSFFCELMHSVNSGQGVVFCPPLVSDDEIILPHERDNMSAAMPKGGTSLVNDQYLYKMEQPQGKGEDDHKRHK